MTLCYQYLNFCRNLWIEAADRADLWIFYRIAILKKLAEFTRKHLQRSSCVSKVSGLFTFADTAIFVEASVISLEEVAVADVL